MNFTNTPENIYIRFHQINKQQLVLNRLLHALQDECLHDRHTKTPHSNSGGWDNLADEKESYWYSIHCPDCNKRWIEVQHDYNHVHQPARAEAIRQRDEARRANSPSRTPDINESNDPGEGGLA